MSSDDNSPKKTTSPASAKGKKGFPKGKSGNPAGRPKGSLNKTTLALQAMLAGEAEEITATCIELAKAGEPWAVKLVIERLIPVKKSAIVNFKMVMPKGPQDLQAAYESIFAAGAQGELTVEEMQNFVEMLDSVRKSFETVELAERLAKLEELVEASQ